MYNQSHKKFLPYLDEIAFNEAILKLSNLFPILAPNRLITLYSEIKTNSGKRLIDHTYSLFSHIDQLRKNRGLNNSAYVESLILALYHDLPKTINLILDRSKDPLISKIFGDNEIGHSSKIRRLFFFIEEPFLAHSLRHNSTDFVIDIANRHVTVPQLVLNLVDKSDDSGKRVSIWEKYELIKKAIGDKPGYDDFSEKLACKYLDRVTTENTVLSDYEFITKLALPEINTLFVQRFDGKYCAPIGAYKDTSSNLKISREISKWGYRTLILHEGNFRYWEDLNKTEIHGCDSECVDQLLPLYCSNKDLIFVEGSTTRLALVRKIVGTNTALVLLLRTLADGFMTKERLVKAINADEIWVMTVDMQDILTSNFIEAGFSSFPQIKILQSGVDEDIYKTSSSISRINGKITYVGALTDIKGVDVLIAAFKKLHSKYPEVQLHLIGNPEVYGRVNMFDTKDIEKIPGVHYHGILRSEQIAKHLMEAHFSVLLTKIYETFGKSAMQARCCGTKMIVSSNGYLPHHVQSREEGIVVYKLSEEEVFNAMETLYLEEPRTVPPPQARYHNWKITALDFISNYDILNRKVFQRELEMVNKSD